MRTATKAPDFLVNLARLGTARPPATRRRHLLTGALLAGGSAALPLASAHAGNHGEALGRILDQRRLRIIVRLDLPPLGYRDARAEPAGFDVAIGRILADGLGVAPVFVETLTADAFTRLSQGEGDIICHVPLGVRAARQALLTAPCGRVYLSLASPGWLPFRRPSALDGHAVGLLAGGESEAMVSEALPSGTRLHGFATLSGLSAALLAGRIEAMVVPRPALAPLQRGIPQLDLTHRFDLAPRWISIGLPFGEHDLLRALNSLIFLARTQGRLAALSEALLGLPQPELPSF
jgi:polar amino acid transport system substrate-binding protein